MDIKIKGKKQSIDKIKLELENELGINKNNDIRINDFMKLDCFNEKKG